MRTLRRDSATFEYRPLERTQEVMLNGLHTGNQRPVYGDPVQYLGNISAPSGIVTDNLFGVNTPYTHVLLMGDTEADIKEEGLITWKDCDYDVMAVRPSPNVLAIALKKRTANRAAGE